MPKVTSKLQFTIPKAIAEQYSIRPGDQLDLSAAGEGIRMLRRRQRTSGNDSTERLRLFDLATERQRRRQAKRPKAEEPPRRGWRREDLYTRGLAR